MSVKHNIDTCPQNIYHRIFMMVLMIYALFMIYLNNYYYHNSQIILTRITITPNVMSPGCKIQYKESINENEIPGSGSMQYRITLKMESLNYN